MKEITLGKTGIKTVQNAFGALPIQRVDDETAIEILRKAYDGGITFFDTARAYSDSEHKMGLALSDVREKIFIASKTMAKTPEDFWEQLETSLKELKTDYLDLYQFHCVGQCYRPGDGTGLYECMEKAKKEGKIRHIGVTAHLIQIAEECVESGLYETLQFPFSYLSSEREENLVKMCQEKGMGFIAMKGLAGGLINKSDAAMAYMSQFENVLPIWGVQKISELDEWLSYMDETPEMNDKRKAFIEKEREELAGEFCRGCGYCMPCTVGIQINQCARMSLMIRRAPAGFWLSEMWQKNMEKIKDCKECGICKSRCPYGLDIPKLLKENLEDYKTFLEPAQ